MRPRSASSGASSRSTLAPARGARRLPRAARRRRDRRRAPPAPVPAAHRERVASRALAAGRRRAGAHRARGRARGRARRDRRRRRGGRDARSSPRASTRSCTSGAARSSASGCRLRPDAGGRAAADGPLRTSARDDAEASRLRRSLRLTVSAPIAAGAAAFAVGATRRPLAGSGWPGCSRSAARCSTVPAPETPRTLRPPDGRATRSLPSSSRLSKSPGETFEPVTARRIGANASRGFSPARLGEPAQRLLDRERLPRLDRPERGRRGAGRSSGSAAVGADRLEQEADAVRVLRELLDLLLHERHGRADALLGPVDPLLAQPARAAVARTPPAAASRRWTPFSQSSFS